MKKFISIVLSLMMAFSLMIASQKPVQAADTIDIKPGRCYSVHLVKGYTHFKSTFNSKNGLKIYTTAAAAQNCDSNYALSSSYMYGNAGEVSERWVKINKTGDYYIGSSYSSATEPGYVDFVFLPYPAYTSAASAKTVGVANKEVRATGFDYTPQYFKFKATKTGFVTGQFYYYDRSYSFYYELLNGSKKSITNGYISNGKIGPIGVKKGQTYYIRVKTYCNGMGIKLKNTARANQGGAKKGKALKIKKKKTKKSLLVGGSASTKWFKYKQPKKTKFRIKITQKLNYNYNQSNGLKITVYYGKKKVGSPVKTYNSTGTDTITVTYGTTYGKANKGTYYIKVSGYGKATGYYNIKCY